MFKNFGQILFHRIFYRTDIQILSDAKLFYFLFFVGGFYIGCWKDLRKDNKKDIRWILANNILVGSGISIFGALFGVLYPFLIAFSPILLPPIIYDILISNHN